MSEQEIFDNAYPLGSFSGIYFLLKGRSVIYVGKSEDVEHRIGQHRSRRKIDFDAVYMIECPVSEMARLEARYIRSLRPPLNSAIPLGTAVETPPVMNKLCTPVEQGLTG